MKDKQIIIDGVNVRGCEHCLKMTKYRCTIQRDVYKCLCEENPNCHYKLYKRKEQECEMFVKALKNKTDEYNKLAVNYDAYVSMAKKKLQEKEQECEELKEQVQYLEFEIERISEQC